MTELLTVAANAPGACKRMVAAAAAAAVCSKRAVDVSVVTQLSGADVSGRRRCS